jgi:hypothetical protein
MGKQKLAASLNDPCSRNAYIMDPNVGSGNTDPIQTTMIRSTGCHIVNLNFNSPSITKWNIGDPRGANHEQTNWSHQ